MHEKIKNFKFYQLTLNKCPKTLPKMPSNSNLGFRKAKRHTTWPTWGHLDQALSITLRILKLLIFSCILGGLRLFYTIGKLYTQTRYGKPCVFLLSLDQKSSAIHVSSSVFSALLESPVKGRIFWFLLSVFRNNCVFLTYFSWKWVYNFPIV